MKLKVIEKEKDKVELELDDQTLAKLINEKLWNQKIDYAATAKDHPYLSKPHIILKTKDAKKALIKAADDILDDVDDLSRKFSKQAK